MGAVFVGDVLLGAAEVEAKALLAAPLAVEAPLDDAAAVLTADEVTLGDAAAVVTDDRLATVLEGELLPAVLLELPLPQPTSSAATVTPTTARFICFDRIIGIPSPIARCRRRYS